MPTKILTFFFGRLNITSYANNKKDLILTGLRTDKFFDSNQFKYGFFDVQEINDEFVYGRLVKYKRVLEGEIVDEESHRTIVGGLPYGIVAKSDFFLHYKSGVIAFRPLASRISAKQFRGVFARLFEIGHDNFFVSAQIETIDEGIKIEEAIKKFEVVRKITFDIHPTNPSNRDVYKRVDERLKRLKADKLKQIVESDKEDGLDKSALLEDETYRSLVMATDGYGNGSIHGVTEGRKVVITTGDSPVRKEIVENELEEMLEDLLPTFKRIWNRIKE